MNRSTMSKYQKNHVGKIGMLENDKKLLHNDLVWYYIHK